jgi:hypothetical protein
MHHVPGILILYHTPCWGKVAPTVVENYSAFNSHSDFPVWEVNTEFGFPTRLSELRFNVIVLHYTLFGRGYDYEIPDAFCRYLHTCPTTRIIAFFQDEYRYCRKRFAFINEFHVDTVYTCLNPRHFPEVYGKYTSARHLKTYLPGYVSETLVREASRRAKPPEKRTIDVGYRARRLEFYMGKGAQEKHEIGVIFECMAREYHLPLHLDIRIGEENRIHGENWYEFLGNCKGMLGVESGVSIIDLNDEIRPAGELLLKNNPHITFQEFHDRVLKGCEGNIQLRTISPRHFEAAAFRVCQILFEGDYSDIMQPHIHYIPLKKDFSNFPGVIAEFSDAHRREEITRRAYSDLIDTGIYSYKHFIRGFDEHLNSLGLNPPSGYDRTQIETALREDISMRLIHTWIKQGIYIPFPGRSRLRSLIRKAARLK